MMDYSRESAATRALAIPEILSAILLPLQHHKDRPLISCTLVNSQWESQANSLLWEECGSDYSKSVKPAIRALASLPPARRQRYAKMIRVLAIQVQSDLEYRTEGQYQGQWDDDQQIEQYQGEDRLSSNVQDDVQEEVNDPEEADMQGADQQDNGVHEDNLQNEFIQGSGDYDPFDTLLAPGSWAGIHLGQLRNTSFPRLEELVIEGPTMEEDSSGFQPDLLMPFAQPKLKKLWIHEGDVQCDMVSLELLEKLEENCKGLRDVSIGQGIVCVSIERIRSFLMSISTLESTSLSWNQYMSTDLFQAVSRFPYLKRLALDFIKDEWVDSIPFHEESSGSTFPSLTTFNCTVSAHCFRGMLPYLDNIRQLYLIEIDDTPGLWQALSLGEFKSLESLQVYLHDDTALDSGELLAVLQHTSKLNTLMLSGSRNDYDESVSIRMEPFDDSVIDAVAKCVPMLESLDLQCTSTTGNIGENSLLALGASCPLLQSISMPATVDWARFVKISPQGLWTHLHSISVHKELAMWEDWTGFIGDKDRELAKQIKLVMPALSPHQGLSFGNDPAFERAVIDEFTDKQKWQEDA